MADDLSDVMRALGRIEGTMNGSQADIVEGKKSRERIHGKLEKIEDDVHYVAKIAEDARDAAAAVTKVVTEDVKPVTDDIKRLRLMGAGFSVAVGLAAGSLGVGIATWGGQFLDWLRSLGKH